MKRRWISIAAASVLAMGTMTAAASENETEMTVRVGSLKGPTSMGLVSLMEDNENGETGNNYDFTMVTAADELLAQMIGGKLDIALIPANVSSVLYQKTDAGIHVIDINTLGVVYAVSGDSTVKTISDLKGKTVYLTGKGTTPDYVLQYLLEENGVSLDEVKLEYKSEATEVAAVLASDPNCIGILPQPFVTVAMSKNENLKRVLDLTEEWDKVNSDSRLVTGVTVVRDAFLEENEEAVAEFLKDHEDSSKFVNENIEEGAELIAKRGIIEKAPIAQKAIPYCNITCITGEEMKEALSGYLQVLYEMAPESVGGELPDDEFYLTDLEN